MECSLKQGSSCRGKPQAGAEPALITTNYLWAMWPWARISTFPGLGFLPNLGKSMFALQNVCKALDLGVPRLTTCTHTADHHASLLRGPKPLLLYSRDTAQPLLSSTCKGAEVSVCSPCTPPAGRTPQCSFPEASFAFSHALRDVLRPFLLCRCSEFNQETVSAVCQILRNCMATWTMTTAWRGWGRYHSMCLLQ